MEVTWPGGESTTITEGLSVNTTFMIEKDPLGTGFASQSGTHLPSAMTLLSNYPNPFNPSTTIRYSLEKDGHVSLKIYDTLGRKVKTLVDGIEPAGQREIVWDGTDNTGNHVSSGVYMYVLSSGANIKTHKMLLEK